MDVRIIRAGDARPLRAAILRPGRPFEASVYPLDEDEEALHVGVFHEGRLVTVASIFREPQPGEINPKAWRLRGMATVPEMQRRGFGRAALERCMAHVARQGGTALWCNARINAVDFYRSLQFETMGGEQQTPHGNSFIRMLRAISSDSSTN